MLFLFGPTKDSWIIGNDLYTTQYGMAPIVKGIVEDGSVSAKMTIWGSVGPDGLVFFSRGPRRDKWGTYIKDGLPFFTQDENLTADVNRGGVQHVTFSPGGGWFVKYNDGQVRLSMKGTFPDVFHELAAQDMQTKGFGASSLQKSPISNIFFGANNAVIIQYNVLTKSWWDKPRLRYQGLPAELDQFLQKIFKENCVLTRNTSLCPWDNRYYFIEFTDHLSYGWNLKHFYNLPTHAMLPPIFFRQIYEEEYPSSIPAEPTTPVTPPQLQRPPNPTQNNGAKPQPPALPPRQPISKVQYHAQQATSTLNIDMIREMCEDIFEQWSGSTGTIDGVTFQRFCQSVLPNTEIAKIWSLSDLDHNGTFSYDEFIIAVYLMMSRVRGTNLPEQLPLETILKARVQKDSLVGRKTTIWAKNNNPPQCMKCKTNIECGAWMCWNCQRCAEIGTTNKGMMFCTSCVCFTFPELLTLATNVNHSLAWRKLLWAKGGDEVGAASSKPASWICDTCGSYITAERSSIPICSKCEFGECKSCYKPGHMCPNRHLLAPKEDLASIVDSMILEGVRALKPFLVNEPKNSEPKSSEPKNSSSNTSSADPYSPDAVSKQLKDALMSSIVTESPNVKWDDVAGLQAAKEELQEAVILPTRFPEIFKGRKASRGILLYGPPGTGKSYLAKAVATEADAQLFSISASDVISKWIGESERLVKTLFNLARENKPSIVFVDEIDSICGNRDALGASPLAAGIKTEFLVQMDGVGHNNDGVLVLAATNLPWSLDPALRRRMQKKVYIPLPDESARAKMFEIHVGETSCGLTPAHYKDLARRAKGLSGSDIGNAVQDAKNKPIKKLSSSKHWRKVMQQGEEKLTPCSPQDYGAMPMNWRQVSPSQLLLPAVTVEDFYEALKNVKPTVLQDEIKKYSEWTNQFGMEGS